MIPYFRKRSCEGKFLLQKQKEMLECVSGLKRRCERRGTGKTSQESPGKSKKPVEIRVGCPFFWAKILRNNSSSFVVSETVQGKGCRLVSVSWLLAEEVIRRSHKTFLSSESGFGEFAQRKRIQHLPWHHADVWEKRQRTPFFGYMRIGGARGKTGMLILVVSIISE